MTGSDYNVASVETSPSPLPGPNSLLNTTLGEISFIDSNAGFEKLCTSNTSVAYISGPRMIDESDHYKIYYDASGKLRNPNDTNFPLGACSQ